MNNDEHILLIDEDEFFLSENDTKRLASKVEDFVDSYTQKGDKPLDEWLYQKMKGELPEKENETIRSYVEEIITGIKCAEEKKEALSDAQKKGKSKENWFATEIENVMSGYSVFETAKYLNRLDVALREANNLMYNTTITKSGSLNLNPQLDGYIAEQYHAQSFNLNAAAKGSPYRAKVLEPDGVRYAENGVDVVITDAKGDIVRKYQAKYCRDAKATQEAFEKGNYRGQQKLIPEGQENGITKKTTTFIEAPDGTRSNPLSKQEAQKLRDEAQSGNWKDQNWNAYKNKDLAIGIGKQAGKAALLGAAIGVSTDIAGKLYRHEKIDVKEEVKIALEDGIDFGIKAAITGALKVGAEKQYIKVIPKGTPAGVIANGVFIAVEDVKILYDFGKGELTIGETLEQMEMTTASALAGFAFMAKGSALGAVKGAYVGALFGPEGIPIGMAIGGFVGGVIGYMGGAKAGEIIVKGRRKLQQKLPPILKSHKVKYISSLKLSNITRSSV